MEELVYKLIFCEGLGIVGKWRLIHFAMKFDYTDFNIDEVIKITNTSGNKGVLKESWQTLTTEWLQEKRNTQKSISFFSERYPESLKNIAQPPLALFYEGNIDFLEYPSIAMVGARLATPYASQVLYQFIPKLVLENLVIVSGLAKGVDRLVLSEYPLGTPIKKHHFPMRNRIIAGLTQGTCVIEAKERSGSLITAQLALDNGKEVFAIPGEILSGQSSGCHRLIQDGAKCVYRMEDILEELPQYRLDFLKP